MGLTRTLSASSMKPFCQYPIWFGMPRVEAALIRNHHLTSRERLFLLAITE